MAWRRAVALRSTEHELDPLETLRSELCPQVLERLDDTRQLLERLLADADALGRGTRSLPPPAAERGFEHAVDATVSGQADDLQALGDVTSMALMELGQRRSRLQTLSAGGTRDALLAECDSALRRMRKALSAVDTTLARCAGVKPTLPFNAELDVSLAIRRAYARFRQRVLADGPPSANTLKSRLRLAGVQIAMLIGHEIYPELRIRDRLLLRSLQHRILAWLRAGGTDDAEGMRLWQDLASSLEILALVSQRQELVEYDARALAEQGSSG